MTEDRLRMTLALLFLAAQFATPVLTFYFFTQHGFTFEELTTTVAIVAPLTAGHATLVVKHIVEHRSSTSGAGGGPRQSPAFVALSLSLVLLFALALNGLVVLKANNIGIQTFEQFKILLALIDGLFAVRIGLIIRALFQSSIAKTPKRPRGGPASG